MCLVTGADRSAGVGWQRCHPAPRPATRCVLGQSNDKAYDCDMMIGRETSGDTGAGATSVRLTVAPPTPTLTVTAGGYLALCVTLRNTGPAADRYTVVVEGIPAAWCRVDRLSFPLAAGAARRLPLIIHPPATAVPVVRVPLTVRVVSHHARAVQASATAALTVQPPDGDRAAVRYRRGADGSLAPAPPTLPGRGRSRRRLRVTAPAVFVALLALVAGAFVYAVTVPEPGGLPTVASAPAALPYIQEFQGQGTAGAPTGALTWRVTGADRITLNGRPVAATGTQARARGGTTATYALRATNGQGTVASRVTVARARGPGTLTSPPRPRGSGLSVAVARGAGRARAGLGRRWRPGAAPSRQRRSQRHPRRVTRAPQRQRIVRARRGAARASPRRAHPRAGPAAGPSSCPVRRAAGHCARPRRALPARWAASLTIWSGAFPVLNAAPRRWGWRISVRGLASKRLGGGTAHHPCWPCPLWIGRTRASLMGDGRRASPARRDDPARASPVPGVQGA